MGSDERVSWLRHAARQERTVSSDGRSTAPPPRPDGAAGHRSLFLKQLLRWAGCELPGPRNQNNFKKPNTMKRITIFDHQVGLVFRRGRFLRALLPGAHWVFLWDRVRVYETTAPFRPPVELELLLEDPELRARLEVLEVRDHEIALHYRNSIFEQVLGPGRHPFWKGIVDHAFRLVDLNETEVPADIDRAVLRRPDLLPHVRAFQVAVHEAGLLVIDGRFVRRLEPGTYYYWKGSRETTVLVTDLRVKEVELNGQEMLTLDKAALRVSFLARYRVVDVEAALLGHRDAIRQLYLALQLALREYVGSLTLDELLTRKEQVGTFVLRQVAAEAAGLGFEVFSAGIRDVILPGEVKEIMNQVLVAQKQAQASTIARREETAATRSLLNTAKLLEEHPMLLRLKEMEYVDKIAEKISHITVAGGTQVVEQLRQLFLKED